MSDYCKMKVLRVPFEHCAFGSSEDYGDLEAILKEKLDSNMLYYGGEHVGKFDIAPTYKPFIDFVLKYNYGEDCGEYGKVRELYPEEKLKYIEVFKLLNPDIDMDNVRLVEFCWYNCSEAPDYYELTEDEFYTEIPLICNFI